MNGLMVVAAEPPERVCARSDFSEHHMLFERSICVS